MIQSRQATPVISTLLAPILLLFTSATWAQVSALDYAQQCEKLIGKLPDFNCFDGAEVKPTGRGRDPDGRVACDNPTLLVSAPARSPVPAAPAC